eukprot:CAMPEP_0179039888 /NCGR_PEP_ID=MMETSP0796-20121207/15367_1 /TAXON_ID=73915 /ORGANISM="Pyrodinium bahamense, Strain pbaha01" /LENGTH=466 /DNA_ID=CAMNT_0020736223 /DNA_START=129 /DNA_END=1529 /DNA_ORIENTATION=-
MAVVAFCCAVAGSVATAWKWPHGPSQAFVQLFEWSWEDIAIECEELLGPKGFTAVQISPPNEHTTGSSWHVRYQPVSYKLVSRSGNASQFAEMVKRCRAAGVGIYADAVINHQAPYSGVGVAGSQFGYRNYPLYNPGDFHHLPGDNGSNCGVSNYDDVYNVQFCDLAGMPDLCTECPGVQEKIAAYVNGMAKIGIAGIRVDAAKNMDAGALGQLLSRVNGSLFRFQEVPFGGAVEASMYYGIGPVAVFGYASTLDPKFAEEGLLCEDLEHLGEGWGLPPEQSAVVFLDNHDTQRAGAQLTYKNWDIYRLASIFMLAHPYGYPRVMSSYFFSSYDQGPPSEPVHGPNGELRCGLGHPWACEHRAPAIANMVSWRRSAGNASITKFIAVGSALAFCRGEEACVALNRMDQPLNATVEFSLPIGEYCDVIQSDATDCPGVHVHAGGVVHLLVPARGAVALHVGALRALV